MNPSDSGRLSRGLWPGRGETAYSWSVVCSDLEPSPSMVTKGFCRARLLLLLLAETSIDDLGDIFGLGSYLCYECGSIRDEIDK